MIRALLARLPGGDARDASRRRPRASCSATTGRTTCASSRRRSRRRSRSPTAARSTPERSARADPPRAARPPAPPAAPPPPLDDDALRARLVALLESHDGNVAAVARAIGKDRMQIHRWVRRFALDLDSYRR